MMKTPAMKVSAGRNLPSPVAVAVAKGALAPKPSVRPVLVPGTRAPVVSGAMPTKVFVNPQLAAPIKPYQAGLNTVAVITRRNSDTRGRTLQRGTR